MHVNADGSTHVIPCKRSISLTRFRDLLWVDNRCHAASSCMHRGHNQLPVQHTVPLCHKCAPMVQKKKNRLSMTWWVAAATGSMAVALAVKQAAAASRAQAWSWQSVSVQALAPSAGQLPCKHSECAAVMTPQGRLPVAHRHKQQTQSSSAGAVTTTRPLLPLVLHCL